MTTSRSRASATAFALGLFTILLSGCVVAGGGPGYDDGGYGVGYYEPYGGDYGGWGSGYQVAPYRGGDRRGDRGGGQSASHAYRSAPASHAMPSIPSRSSGGGGRGGSTGHR